MLIDIRMLARKYNMNVSGVLHVGAHEGEEADIYDQLGWNPVYWVDAQESTIPALSKNVGKRPGHHVVHAACADKPQTLTFHIANNGQSSSLLEFGTHSEEHPEVVFKDEIQMEATTIDLLAIDEIIGQCSFINLDVQGAELMVLEGASEYLDGVKYVYSEINQKELYKGCVQLPELDEWLRRKNYHRRDTIMTPHGWGDAIYIRGDVL